MATLRRFEVAIVHVADMGQLRMERFPRSWSQDVVVAGSGLRLGRGRQFRHCDGSARCSTQNCQAETTESAGGRSDAAARPADGRYNQSL